MSGVPSHVAAAIANEGEDPPALLMHAIFKHDFITPIQFRKSISERFMMREDVTRLACSAFWSC